MLIQILTHTPLYVWAILALLVVRGVIAMRDREMAIWKLPIIPVLMVAISVQDLLAKFHAALSPLAAWAGAAVVATMLVSTFSSSGVSAGASSVSVRMRGSWVPLAVMMGIFFTKYAMAVSFVIQPQLSHNALFSNLVGGLLGMFNGYFVGQLVRDFNAWESVRGSRDTPVAAV